MAQSISLMGATYNDVPAVTLPKSGGGSARFDDCTVVTATASDVASGKVFVAADGTVTNGTASGGGGNDFIVELSYDDNTDRWIPDCTFSDIVSAYNANKTIATLTNVGNSDYTSTGYYDSLDDAFYYSVVDDFDYPNSEWRIGYYTLYSNGVQFNGDFEYISPPTGTINITQNGTVNVTNYATADVNVSGGGLEEKDVNFFDYDGTLLYSYTAQEIQAMTQESDLPENPSHTGLTAQGWNWTLAQIKAQFTSTPNGVVYVGQMYVTSDGKTRLYINIPNGTESLPFYVRFTQTVANGVTVDWGDGNSETYSGTSATNHSHTYAQSGNYIVTLTVTSGKVSFAGSSSYSIYGSSSNYYNRKRIVKFETGKDVTSIGNYAFRYCYFLESATTSKDITTIGNYAFSGCNSLKAITIPNSVTSFGTYAFANCYSLKSITISNSVTSIGTYAFDTCVNLRAITIPNSVTSIGTYAFQNCYSLKSATISGSIINTSAYMFYYCYCLDSVVIGNGIIAIGDYSFHSCKSLSAINIPSGVTSIGMAEFRADESLKAITIPSSVTSIAAQAFYGCYSLEEIHFKPNTPPTVGNANAWTNVSKTCIIYVPTGKLTDYTTADNYPDPNTYTYVEESA